MSRTFPRPRATLLPVVLAMGFLAGACASSGLSDEERRRIEAEQDAIRQNELQLQRLQRLQEMTEQQFLEVELKRLQSAWLRDAAAALRAGRYEACIDLVEKVFHPPPKEETVRVPVFETDEAGRPTAKRKLDGNGKPVFEEVLQQKPYPAVELERPMEASARAMMGNAAFQLAERSDDPEESKRRLQEAIVAYRQAQQVDPKNRSARRNLGRILYRQAAREPARAAHWYRQALREWQEELSAGFRDAELMVLVGQALYETGEKEAAAVAFQMALPEMPRNRDLVQFLATIYMEVGKEEEALRLADVLLENDPFNASVTAQKAHLLARIGRRDQAMETLEIFSLAGGAMNPGLWTLLGDLYAQKGMPGPAADALLEAYGGEPETIAGRKPEDAVLVADLLVQAARPADPEAGRPRPDFETAVRLLESVERDPDASPDTVFADAAFTAGRLHQVRAAHAHEAKTREEQSRMALAAYRRGLAEVGTNGYAWLAAGDLAFSLAQEDFELRDARALEEAHRAYERASSLPETACDAFLGLGDVAYVKGDFGKAADYYRKVLEKRPDDPAVISALQAVKAEKEWTRNH